ncbi:hypothetical protein, partial [Salmonella enterica]|uniref:hypothetical protein n=1 Tax=Salmonella enterica TaxID=28901 RepID=UPI003297A0EE
YDAPGIMALMMDLVMPDRTLLMRAAGIAQWMRCCCRRSGKGKTSLLRKRGLGSSIPSEAIIN